LRSCEQRRCLAAEGTFVKASAFCLPLFGSGSTGLGSNQTSTGDIPHTTYAILTKNAVSRRFFWNILDAERTVNYDIHITILFNIFYLLFIIDDSEAINLLFIIVKNQGTI